MECPLSLSLSMYLEHKAKKVSDITESEYVTLMAGNITIEGPRKSVFDAFLDQRT